MLVYVCVCKCKNSTFTQAYFLLHTSSFRRKILRQTLYLYLTTVSVCFLHPCCLMSNQYTGMQSLLSLFAGQQFNDVSHEYIPGSCTENGALRDINFRKKKNVESTWYFMNSTHDYKNTRYFSGSLIYFISLSEFHLIISTTAYTLNSATICAKWQVHSLCILFIYFFINILCMNSIRQTSNTQS